MTLGGAMPHLMTAWHQVAVPVGPQEHAQQCAVDMTNVSSILGKVWEMSQDQTHCRTVQKLLEDSIDKDRIAIAEELRGRIWDAIHHPYANYVLQKCIETMRPEACQFIIDELMSSDRTLSVAQHKFGSRIVRRLLEFSRADQVSELV